MYKNPNSKYDLEERTAKFGESIIKFAKNIPVNEITRRMIPQLIASATSIGANYCEADDAESGKDFKHKIGISKKEAREVKYWIRMIVVALPEMRNDAIPLWIEAKELNLILNSIYYKVAKKNNK